MTAALLRDRATGRFAPRPTFPTCPTCGWTLAETLAAGLYCPHQSCAAHRQIVGVVAGVDIGGLDAVCVGGAA